MVMAWYATQPQAAVAQNISDDTILIELERIEAVLDKASL
jgi:hypothetical protein